jgi:hypothetical protein
LKVFKKNNEKNLLILSEKLINNEENEGKLLDKDQVKNFNNCLDKNK